MRNIKLFLVMLCFGFGASAQILVIGRNFLNNVPLSNTQITVKAGGVITKTLSTRAKTEFQIELDYGQVYQVYVQNAKCVVMFFEVVANTIPKNKYDFLMSHQFDLPFVNKTDTDVDTTVFQKAFYRIVFDGKKTMEYDTAYSRKFDSGILKKKVKEEAVSSPTDQAVNTEKKILDQPSIFAGHIFLNSDKLQPLKDKQIYAVDKDGKVIRTTKTNRFGTFAFTGIKPIEIHKIRMALGEVDKATYDADGNYGLYNDKDELQQFTKAVNNTCEWSLNSKGLEKLTDNNYTSNIGGKLVSSSPREKKFFSNKSVYLSNHLNTVIQKTKTNTLGSFVFEDIKPDNTYFIGVDNTELKPGERIDVLNKDDSYIATLDSVRGGKSSLKINTDINPTFNKMTIVEDEMKMDIKATIFGDNVNQPIGKLKIILLNDTYQPIDSVITDNFGAFKFKYLPFLKRFYLSAENTNNVLDVYKNILIYSGDQNLVKVMTHQKGKKFTYNPVSGELSSLRDIELDDPWLEYVEPKSAEEKASAKRSAGPPKQIIENILFETNKADITDQAKEVLDKIILVLNTNKQLKIEIGAHTDSKGEAATNLQLSNLRAKNVKDYISKAGIDAKRINTVGYGESKLLNKCSDNQTCSEAEHAINRRIEFKILGE